MSLIASNKAKKLRIPIKGQLISKGHFGFFNSTKEQTKVRLRKN